MGNRAGRKKESRKEKISQRVASKNVDYNEENYILDIYPSKDHKNSFQSVMSTRDQGVVYQGDNYPSIGEAINSTKYEFLNITY